MSNTNTFHQTKYDFKPFISLLFAGIYIQRRNTFPKVVFISQMEHGALEIQLAYIIANIIKESQKVEVNLLKIYEYLFWRHLFDFKFSNIKKDVMHYIKNDYKQIYDKLWEKLKNDLVQSNIPLSLKSWIKRFFKHPPRKIEQQIIELSKSIVSQIEIEHDKNIFENEYDWPFSFLQSTENKLIKELGITDNLHKITRILYKLKFVERWNNTQRLNHMSVLQHTFLVFALTYILGVTKEIQNLEELLSKAIFHDLAEAFTGDIPSPTKKLLPELENTIEEIEKKLVTENLLYLFAPYNFKDALKSYILSPFKWRNFKLLKTSDNLSALIEASLEIFPIFREKTDLLISKIDTNYPPYAQIVDDILSFSVHN